LPDASPREGLPTVGPTICRHAAASRRPGPLAAFISIGRESPAWSLRSLRKSNSKRCDCLSKRRNQSGAHPRHPHSSGQRLVFPGWSANTVDQRARGRPRDDLLVHEGVVNRDGTEPTAHSSLPAERTSFVASRGGICVCRRMSADFGQHDCHVVVTTVIQRKFDERVAYGLG